MVRGRTRCIANAWDLGSATVGMERGKVGENMLTQQRRTVVDEEV
jgi:hypothetical protein